MRASAFTLGCLIALAGTAVAQTPAPAAPAAAPAGQPPAAQPAAAQPAEAPASPPAAQPAEQPATAPDAQQTESPPLNPYAPGVADQAERKQGQRISLALERFVDVDNRKSRFVRRSQDLVAIRGGRKFRGVTVILRKKDEVEFASPFVDRPLRFHQNVVCHVGL